MYYYSVIISGQVVGYFTVVGGLGFGVASGAVMFSNVLKSSAGPGTVGIFGDSSLFILESGKHIYVTVCVYTCACVCVCVHVCMRTHMYVHDIILFLCVTAFTTSVFILLHTCWGILFFDGVKQKDYFKLVVTLLSHMLASCVVSHFSIQLIHGCIILSFF